MKPFPASESYLQENFHLFGNSIYLLLLNKKTWFSSYYYYCFLYGRFLNLRGAGRGVPLASFGWVHPEVTQTPGGPGRPGWPLSPGLPMWPLSPGFPGWPLNALPGRPGMPVVERRNAFLIVKILGKTELLPITPTYHLAPGLQCNQGSHNLYSLYHLALLAHLQVKHTEKFILNY